MIATEKPSRIGIVRGVLTGWTLANCANPQCPNHTGDRFLCRIPPRHRLSIQPVRWAVSEFRCRNCHVYNYVVPAVEKA